MSAPAAQDDAEREPDSVHDKDAELAALRSSLERAQVLFAEERAAVANLRAVTADRVSSRLVSTTGMVGYRSGSLPFTLQ